MPMAKSRCSMAECDEGKTSDARSCCSVNGNVEQTWANEEE